MIFNQECLHIIIILRKWSTAARSSNLAVKKFAENEGGKRDGKFFRHPVIRHGHKHLKINVVKWSCLAPTTFTVLQK
jgi:hypothetical protein